MFSEIKSQLSYYSEKFGQPEFFHYYRGFRYFAGSIVEDLVIQNSSANAGFSSISQFAIAEVPGYLYYFLTKYLINTYFPTKFLQLG